MTNFLLDTNVLLRRLFEPSKLSREQNRVLDDLEQRGKPLLISSISVLEMGILRGQSALRSRIDHTLDLIEENPLCGILHMDVAIAREIAALIGVLRDPYHSAIVATARVHRLKLLTADQRIIESGLANVVE